MGNKRKEEKPVQPYFIELVPGLGKEHLYSQVVHWSLLEVISHASHCCPV